MMLCLLQELINPMPSFYIKGVAIFRVHLLRCEAWMAFAGLKLTSFNARQALGCEKNND